MVQTATFQHGCKGQAVVQAVLGLLLVGLPKGLLFRTEGNRVLRKGMLSVGKLTPGEREVLSSLFNFVII